jgi:hypothetical protein
VRLEARGCREDAASDGAEAQRHEGEYGREVEDFHYLAQVVVHADEPVRPVMGRQFAHHGFGPLHGGEKTFSSRATRDPSSPAKKLMPSVQWK